MKSRRRFTAALTREDGGYVAQCIEVDVASQGDTIDVALSNLREALELYFEGGTDVDVRETPLITSIDVDVPSSVTS